MSFRQRAACPVRPELHPAWPGELLAWRQPAVRRVADQGAVADHPEVSASRRQRLAVHQDAAKASPVPRRQAVSQAFQQPEARSAMVSRSALRRASPAHAWYQPAASRRAAARPEVSSCCRQAAAMRSAQAWWLPPAGALCGRAELPSALA